MACCVLALLYIRHEFDYDRFHPNGKQIYRILQGHRGEDGEFSYDTGASPALRSRLRDGYPFVVRATRIWRRWGLWMRQGQEGFNQVFWLVDPDFLDMFDFPLVNGGDAGAVLSRPGSILVTEDMAKQQFGDRDPVGEILTVDHRFFKGDYTVAGVLKNLPSNTNFDFECLTTTKQGGYNQMWTGWNKGAWRPVEVYLQLAEGASPAPLVSEMSRLLSANAPPEEARNIDYRLQSLERIHLYGRRDFGIPYHGDIDRIYLFATIAFLILSIACINFMNLATARSTKRSREVGLRKVVGAHRAQLVRQFLAESVVLSTIALVVAIGFVLIALPEWSAFVDRELTLAEAGVPSIVMGLLGVSLFVGILSGSYPAFFLSTFRPIDTLKGSVRGGGARVRRILVVAQFGTSIVLMVSTATVYRQLDYIHNKNLGFTSDPVVMAYLFGSDRSLTDRYREIKQAFLQHSGVVSVSAHHTFILRGNLEGFRMEGAESFSPMRRFGIDEDFFSTYEVPIVAGRNFSAEIASDSSSAFILNEAAVRKLGWEDPIGESVEWLWDGGQGLIESGYVVGVAKDFHHQSLHEQILPAVFCMWQPKLAHLSIRIRGDNVEETLAFIHEKWSEFVPLIAPRVWFLDENIERMYQHETRFGNVTGAFSALAVFVACLGLIGLASFTAEQRTKEIGVRKVLGAMVPGLVASLSGGFLKLVLVANVLAWPIAYVLMDGWLQDFAYRAELGPGIFLLCGLASVAVALAAVGFQAWRAAISDPIDALRYE